MDNRSTSTTKEMNGSNERRRQSRYEHLYRSKSVDCLDRDSGIDVRDSQASVSDDHTASSSLDDKQAERSSWCDCDETNVKTPTQPLQLWESENSISHPIQESGPLPSEIKGDVSPPSSEESTIKSGSSSPKRCPTCQGLLQLENTAIIKDIRKEIIKLEGQSSEKGFLMLATQEQLEECQKSIETIQKMVSKTSLDTKSPEEIIPGNIRLNFTEIIETIDVADHLPYLFQEKALELEEMEQINKEDQKSKTSTMLLILLKKSPSVWTKSFLKSLKKVPACEQLLDKITPHQSIRNRPYSESDS